MSSLPHHYEEIAHSYTEAGYQEEEITFKGKNYLFYWQKGMVNTAIVCERCSKKEAYPEEIEFGDVYSYDEQFKEISQKSNQKIHAHIKEMLQKRLKKEHFCTNCSKPE